MNEMIDIFFGLALILTLLSTAVYCVFFTSQKENLSGVGRSLLICSGLMQTLYIASRFWQTGNMPLTTLHETVTFSAWAVTWAFLAFRWRHSVKNLGAFLSAFVLILLITASLLPNTITEPVPLVKTFWLPLHAGTSLVAYGFMGMAFLGGIMYLLQERELKKKRFGYFFSRLPSLETLDVLNNHCLAVGFVFLTVGIVAGALWARLTNGGLWQWDWSLLIWFFYLVQVHQRFTVGWRGRRAAVMSIVGFVLAMLTLWGVAHLAGGVHGNG